MRKAITLFAFMLAFLSLQVHAQDRTISGKVISSQDNMGIPGVSIIIPGTTTGTTTDIDGAYRIGIPSGTKQLQFSGVGLTTKLIDLGESNTVNVTMDGNVMLNPVVVTALGVKREEKSLGYSTQQVKGEEISLAKEANFINSLQGRVAGVTISGSSNMGGSSRILLRGVRSISYENQPLFVVDGVQVNNGNFTTTDQARGALGYDYGNAAQDINPDDIESINVLKGSSATALYGSQGANGVIIITTKKGHARQVGSGKSPIGVSVTSGVTVSQVSVLPEYQDIYGGGASDQFIVSDLDPTQLRANFEYDGSWGPKMEGQMVRQWDSYYPTMPNYGKLTPWVAHPDNIKDFFETGVTTNNNISIDGGNDLTQYRLSYTNYNDKGVIPNENLNRNIFSFSGSNKFSDKLRSNMTLNYVSSNAKGRAATGYNNLTSNFTQWWERQLDMEQLKDYKNPDGTQRTWNMNSETDLSPLYWDNPYWVQYENYETDSRNRIYGVASLAYDFTKELSLTGSIKTDYYNDARRERVAKGSSSISKYTEENITFNENNYELILNYKHNLSENLDLTAFVGGNRQDRKTVDNYFATQGGLNAPNYYSLTNSVDKVLVTPNTTQLRRNSLFASANFGYKHFLFLDLTGRNDWSSTLPNGDNSYFYPSAATSFVYSEFLTNMKWLTYGKLFVSWASTAIDPVAYVSTSTRPVVSSNFGGFATAIVPNRANNPDLKPETTNNIEFGTEFQLFDSRIGAKITYYSTLSKDVIFAVQQSASTGFASKYYNAAEISNKGIELELTGTVIKTKSGLEWGIGFNFAKNTNLVEKLFTDENGAETQSLLIQNAPFSATFQARPGMAYGQIVGYDYAYDANGNHIIDGGAYARTAKVQPLGSVLPNFTGGVSTWVSWKGFRLFGLIDFQDGGKIFSLTNTWGKYSGTLKETAENGIRENGIVLEGVVQTGVDAAGNPISDGTPNTTSIAAVDHFFLDGGYVITAADVYDASFIKFRELSLTYSLPAKIFAKTAIQGLSISLVGRNLGILHKNVPNIDPEAAVSSGNVQGLEGAQLPTTRTYGVTLNIKF
ncbi:MAG: SusC/RagA family TonB-linked outer membrane protein [Bacteroidetes bacterium]|nr:SusC/RagA family TonB-linked outer membrane protein [Bacteroidota bacterium]